MRPRNKPPGSRAPQTSDEIYTCTKSYGAKFEILIKLFLENVEIFHNCLKLPFFGLKIRLLFTDLFRILFRIQFWIWIRIRIRIRIRNDYFGSGSGQKFRFWFRIRNTVPGYSFFVHCNSYSIPCKNKEFACIREPKITTLYTFSLHSVVDPDPRLFGQTGSGISVPEPDLTFMTRKPV
jgi:hypothetical protein